jgi:P-type conjugative transfer protein TrbG
MNLTPQSVIVCGLLFVGVSLSGCAGKRHTSPPPPPPAPLVEAQPIQDPPAPPVAAPEPTTLIDELPPDITQALDKYMHTGKAPIIDHRSSGFVRFPFGLSQPVVTCKAMALCDIGLEPGEKMSGDHALSMADPLRWYAHRIDEGEGEGQIQHVVLKPNDDIPLATDIIIGTNRRIYHVHVVSGAKQTINATFYYPQDAIGKFNAQQAAQQRHQQAVVASGPEIDLTTLHQNYRIECNGARFCPSWVADDGHKTYILLPRGLEAIGLPSLFIEQAGEKQIVNYNTSKLPYYIVERVFDRAVLQSGTTKDAQQVIITREG